MRFLLQPLLSPSQVEALRQALLDPAAIWEDGGATAGWHARTVKHNRQLDPGSPLQQRLAAELEATLLAHPLLQAAALPLRLLTLRFSRCGPGEGYGRHVDNAFLAGGRADLSVTVFLSDPATYDGGALVLEHPGGEEPFRLGIGEALVYPSTLLHRVDPVHSGERLVAVGWFQSHVREADRRELLFELDTARRDLYSREGKSEVFDLLSRCYANLLRLWGEG